MKQRMDLTSTVALCFCIFLGCLLLTIWKTHQKRQRLPPGPTPLPFFGTLRKIKPHLLYETFIELSKEYGSVFTVWMGSAPVVVLCGYGTVKDALVNHAEEFSGRHTIKSDEKVIGSYGITNNNGAEWQTLRRFAIATLRNFGMGKRSMEERVQKEAFHLIKIIKDTDGKAFDPMIPLQSAVSNVICSVMFGERFDYNDQKFLQILHTIDKYFNFIRSFIGQLYNAIPLIMNYLPGPHHRILEASRSLKTFIQEQIESHQQTLNSESPQDFIDCFLMKANKKEPGFRNENLVASTFDMFIAGTETTTGSLQYSLLVMVKYPHIQSKVQEEIDDVVGLLRPPSFADRVKMTYTNAVILEIQRFVDIVPMALPHSMTQDTEFYGYSIPKGSGCVQGRAWPAWRSSSSSPPCCSSSLSIQSLTLLASISLS
ncbi:cytochrome P450 2G1-like isoform X2 [Pleurodeles waltl]|uniref:cytochrome P450 2G1-like isoform X2 n=1 Tax=Pleurodeles waltl TaxID=8319 RepID=UPI0037098508